MRQKADRSLITTADSKANALFIERVEARYPGHRVLGEEPTRDSDGSTTWVIDPLDGTREFLLRIPVWMVAMAHVVDGQPVVGAAYNPSTREIYRATADGLAYRNGQPIRASSRDGRSEPVVICGTGENREPGELSGTLLEGTVEPKLEITERCGLPVVFAAVKTAEGVFDGFLYRARPRGGEPDRRARRRQPDQPNGDWQPLDRPVNGGVGSNGLIHDRLVQAWTGGRA